jgi:hypothetical protein
MTEIKQIIHHRDTETQRKSALVLFFLCVSVSLW